MSTLQMFNTPDGHVVTLCGDGWVCVDGLKIWQEDADDCSLAEICGILASRGVSALAFDLTGVKMDAEEFLSKWVADLY